MNILTTLAFIEHVQMYLTIVIASFAVGCAVTEGLRVFFTLKSVDSNCFHPYMPCLDLTLGSSLKYYWFTWLKILNAMKNLLKRYTFRAEESKLFCLIGFLYSLNVYFKKYYQNETLLSSPYSTIFFLICYSDHKDFSCFSKENSERI